MAMNRGVQPGQILFDKYRVERVLGAGGMGVVVAARHLALDQLVAIKLMLGTDATAAEVGRFVREARVAVRLRSQHVARVFDVAALDDGTPYMVLEYLEGRDLLGLLRDIGALPVVEAVDLILQACEALAEAHALGIVHRDIKPANLFLVRGADGSHCIKVLDFGIAKWTSAGTERLEASRPMGSAPYMAPEQFAAPSRVDPRTDVWGLGATLFHLLTGVTPFHHEGVDTLHSMLHAVLHLPPQKPASLRPDLPAMLEAVLLCCLEKDPAARFAGVADLAAALAPFGSTHASAYAERVARVLGTLEPVPDSLSRPEPRSVRSQDVAPPARPLQQVTPSPAPPPPRRRWSRGALVAGAAVVLVAGAVMALVSSQRRERIDGLLPGSAEAALQSLPRPRDPLPAAEEMAPQPGASAASQGAPHPAPGVRLAPSIKAASAPASASAATPPPPGEGLYGRRR
jgi:serine/threonine-protein kinase